MLKLHKFILDNKDWEQRLREFPYNLKIKRKDGYIIFNYQMVESKWNDITRESRGTIFHEETMTPVCVPFYKFFNKQEGNAAKIDWESAVVQEKLDGSLIKVWFHNGSWHVSTNGMIDAFEPTLQNATYDSYGKLFVEAVERETGKNISMFYSRLCTDYCYMFELATPYNRIVVPYEGFNVWHIGTRHMGTLQEQCPTKQFIGVDIPRHFALNVLDEVIDLPYDKEGYVVVDHMFNRVKIKSPAYVAVHHLKGNSGISDRNIIKLIFNGEDEEFISYFPEFKPDFDRFKNLYNQYIEHVKKDIERVKNNGWFDYPNKKWFIMDVKSDTSILNLPIIIKLYGQPDFDWEKRYLKEKPARHLVEILNKYEKRLNNE